MSNGMSAKGGSASGGKTKIIGFFVSLAKRENITALGVIVAVAGISFVLAFATAGFARYRNLQLAKEKRHSAYEDELRRLSGLTVNLAPAPDPTADWKIYENKKYNFSIKYPRDWQTPRENSAGKEENYLLKISFDEKGIVSKNGGKGFDVFIYSAAKFPGPIGTDNLKKKSENAANEDCPNIDDITLGEKAYQAKEVNIKKNNPCWEETFFYSLTQQGYTFNIVPRLDGGFNIKDFDEKIPLVKTFPIFYDIVSTLDFAQENSLVQAPRRMIQRAASPPRVRYASGASCAHKKDKPRNSKTKGKHMDEDCCPDPDEWPNPRCAYSSDGLGLMRSGPK